MSLTGRQKAGIGLGLAGLGIAIASSLGKPKPPTPDPDPDIPGACAYGEPNQCFGSSLYKCNSAGQWELVQSNSPNCTPEKQIKLDDMSIMPAMPTEGETVYIRCRATNHSAMGETLSRVVNLMIDGELVKSWDLTLDWADSVYLEHTVVAAGIGTHSVGFDGLQKSFEVVVSLPPNLLIPELTKIFDGKALYPQLSHPDADIAYKNRAMETADFTVQRHTLYIPSNNKAIWEFEGNWELGDDKLLYLGPSLRLIEEGAYETTPYTLPGGRWQDRYPNCGLQAVGYEDYINKFANCCLDLRYLPQADWWNWFGVVDWDMGFYQASTDPVSVANGQLWDERAEGHTSGNYKFYVESFFGWNWKGWHYPPVSMNWVVLLEINVAMMLTTGMKDIFPLYSWKVGTLSF